MALKSPPLPLLVKVFYLISKKRIPKDSCIEYMEQATGIEPAYTAWEAVILPLNYACVLNIIQDFCSFLNIESTIQL